MQATRRRLRLRQQCKNNNNNEHAQRLVPGNTMDEYREPWLKF
jgi:hypothetical protein